MKCLESIIPRIIVPYKLNVTKTKGHPNSYYYKLQLQSNKRYILFLGESSESDEDMSRQKFHLVSGPVQKSKSFVRSMKKYLCRNCGKLLLIG